MTADLTRSYRHRLVAPDLPAPTEYLPLLQEMHRNGWYSNFGPLARRLEDELMTWVGASHEACITCSNATAGLSAALLATGRTGPVLVPAFTFSASLGAARGAGMAPIVVDVDEKTWTLDRERLDKALAETAANVVMLVAPFGMRRNWEAELAICRKRNAAVVIDSAAGLGNLRSVEGFDETVCEVFSMHATKPFSVGEGGAIFAHHRQETALRAVLNFALDSYARPEGPYWGFNGKMSEFHAAVGVAQAHRFPDLLTRRHAFASIYLHALARYPQLAYPTDASCAPWQVFPVLLPDAPAAERFIDAAAANGIEIRRYYRPSLSRWPDVQCYDRCPVAEDLSERMCTLPVRALDSGPEAKELSEAVLTALDRALHEH